MKKILDIVYTTTGPFMVNRYPYFDLKYAPNIILKCALGNIGTCPGATVDGKNVKYASQFEVDVLASRFAVKNLYKGTQADYFSKHFSQKENFYVTETGWPSCGASWTFPPPITSNANLITYNTNAIRDVETGGALEDIVGKVFLFEGHDEKDKPNEDCADTTG